MLALGACGDGLVGARPAPDGGSRPDGGTPGSADGPRRPAEDAAAADARPADAASPPDARPPDARPPDARPPDAAPPPDAPAGPERALYVSVYADHVGRVAFDADTAVFRFLLGDAAKEAHLLDFARAQGITELALYDLTTVLGDPALAAALRSFGARARAAGIRRLTAIGSAARAAWDQIDTFQREGPLFDGLLTEIEFWQGDPSFAGFLAVVDEVRALGIVDARGAPLPIAAYVGWFDAAQAAELVRRLDGVLVHAYTTTAERAFPYAAERLGLLAEAMRAAGRSVAVRPIFSAEGEAWRAGDERFMGEWLREHGPGAAEAAFTAAQAASAVADLPLAGFQYYEYLFLERYLAGP